MSKLKENFAKTFTMLKFITRRERIMSTIWILALVLVILSVLPAQAESYANENSGDIFNNPVIVALTGPIFGNNIASRIVAEMLLFTILAVGIMNIFLVVRHTRKDEELNRTEVLRSLPIGRLSTLSATFIFAVIVNIIIALLISVGTAFSGIEGVTTSGAFAYGFAIGFSGIFFAALTSLFCQLFQNARTVTNWIFMTMGVMYILRAIGDMGWLNGNRGQEVLSFISPLGIAIRVKPFAGNFVWPLIVLLLISAVLIVVALWINSLRDIEQGMIPARKGRGRAGKLLSCSFGHSFKLVKTSLVLWAVTLFVLGILYGSIMGDIEAMIAENEYLQQIIGGAGSEAYLGMIVITNVILAMIPVMMVMLRIVNEENEGRTESILATPIKRTKLFFNYLIIAACSMLVMLFLTLLGLWLGSVMMLDNPISFGKIFELNFVYLPVLVFMLGFSALCVGLLPRKSFAAWIYVGFCFFIEFIGGMLNLPSWTKYLTPLGYIPNLALESFSFEALLKSLLLVILGIAAIVMGIILYKKRDIKNC